MPAGRLGPEERRAALARMRQQELDLVVVGGGVTGSGAALDAATRGLTVALVEARDLAAGTSSRSSKLIHGGLRYLEQRNFALVREALHERSLLLRRLAPHLVTPVPFVLPLTHRVWQRGYYGAGVLLYDLMGGARAVPSHRHLSRSAALQLVPSLRRDALIGAIEYHDAQVDDARHTMTVARTAAAHGALVTTSARVVEVLREHHRVTGVRVRDLESGDVFDVRARAVVNATGVWTDEMQEMVGGGTLKVRASKGIHVVVPRARIDSSTGLILRTAVSVLFVIPWGAHWIVGTTDTDWNLDKAHPAASRRDIDYLLGEVNKVLHDPLTHDDIEGVYAGLRPLLTGESESTSRLSREHAVITPVPGLVVVAGGKYTTYRVMAKDAVDAAAAWLGRPVPRSRTEHVPLLGAQGFRALWTRRADLAHRLGVDQSHADRLLRRYGSLVAELLEVVDERPELGRPLEGAPDHLAAEVVYAASHEAALHLDDVLTRRTRTSIEVVDRGVAAAEPTARLMAGVLGWDEETVGREVEHYVARVAAERESQTRPDDETADAARLGAPDVRAAGRLRV